MTWRDRMKAVIERRGTIAGAVVAAAAIGAALLAFASGSGAASQSSLTVNLPPAATDRIYAAPQARGRPIVVIDAGHGGRDPGARSVSGEASEKDLTLALAREVRDDLPPGEAAGAEQAPEVNAPLGRVERRGDLGAWLGRKFARGAKLDHPNAGGGNVHADGEVLQSSPSWERHG